MAPKGISVARHYAKAPKEIRSAPDVRCFAFPNGATQSRVDLSEVEWISPLGVVALLAQCLMATSKGVVVTVSLPADRAVRSYLSRIGFYAALRSQGVPVDEESLDLDQDYSVRACLPVTRVTREIEMEAAANHLQEALQEIKAPGHLLPVVYDVIAELTNNAREHGSPCYVVAQTHSGTTSHTPGMHIAIADFGAGFRSTLQAYAPRSETDAILKSFDDQVSGTGDRLRGMGLGWVLRHVDTYPGAVLEIVSRNGRVRRDVGVFQRARNPDCRGVLATAYFPFSG